MANHNQNGGRDVALPEENQPSWRPEDPPPAREFRRRDDERDDRGRREPRSSDDDRHGHPERGYRRAGRYGEDRLQQLRGRRDEAPSAGSFEDRHRELAADDRSGYGGRGGAWQDRSGSDFEHHPSHGSSHGSSHGGQRGRDFEPERRGLARERMDHPNGAYDRGDERMGYPAGSYSRDDGGPSGTQFGADELHRSRADGHVHRGTGPHRGKGPAGYQRSDERIRELVCESLSDDDQLDASRIEVAVKSGEVTLSGSVEDRRAKRDAEDCVFSVSGVRDVQNLLRIQRDERWPRSNPASAAPVGSHETETSAQDKKHRA